MSYSVDELYKFKETDGGYSVEKYLKINDPTIMALEIPEEYRGRPVVEVDGFHDSDYIKHVVIPPSVREIDGMAFYNCAALEEIVLSEGLEDIDAYAFECTGIKSITLPKSLKMLREYAIEICPELERVELLGEPSIELNNFRWCPKLPTEFAVMGIVCSTDLTSAIYNDDIQHLLFEYQNRSPELYRAEIFEILARNDCFRRCDLVYLFWRIINAGKTELFPLAEKYGMLSAALVDRLIDYSAENHKTETTAFLLEYKRRKFGFKGGDDFEL